MNNLRGRIKTLFKRQSNILPNLEKCREYNIGPPTTVCCFCGLRESIRLSINPSNIDIIARTRNRRCVHRNPERHIYTDSSVTVHLHKKSEKIRIKRGVRQGDTIILTQAVHGNIGEHNFII